MSGSEARYAISIFLPSGTWKDHRGRDIKTIVLNKHIPKSTYWAKDFAVFYPIQSFGVISRVLGNIPESPIQELSDWTVSMPSIFSDGNFSTMDLFFHLKSINEEDENEEFDIVGCEAWLWDAAIPDEGIGKNRIFGCSVVGLSSANGTTTITFSESIGAPVIARKSLPLIFGNSSGEKIFYPVKMTKDVFGVEEVILNETPFGSDGNLYTHIEELNKYVQVSFVNGVTSDDKTKITFVKDTSEAVIKAVSPANLGGPMLVLRAIAMELRKDFPPVNCIAGENLNEENVQVWTDKIIPKGAHLTALSSAVQLGRDPDVNKQREHDTLFPLRLNDKPQDLIIQLEDFPIGISLGQSTSKTTLVATDTNPRAHGNPGLFLDTSQYHVGRQIYPTVSLDADYIAAYNQGSIPGPFLTNSAFLLEFPEYKLLTSEAMVPYMEIGVNCAYGGHIINLFFSVGKEEANYQQTQFSLVTNNVQWIETDFNNQKFNLKRVYLPTPQLFSDTRYGKLTLYLGRANINSDNRADWFELRRVRVMRKVRFPYSDNVKLYASPPSHKANGENENQKPMIPALEDLLKEVNSDYTARAEGNLDNTAVNCVMTDESAEFRAKLKTLAIASSAFVKFGKASKEFIASPLNLKTSQTETKEIPLKCLILENNFYSFSTRTPMKDQIYSGLEFCYGKNTATGKYEHRILIDAAGVSCDGELSAPVAAGPEWEALNDRLGRNSANGINNLKSIENEWVRDREGAERAAYTYLSWCCAPLCTAQIKCVKQLLPGDVDIGAFISLGQLPREYPSKLREIVWLVTAIDDNLDSHVATVSLLETWNAKRPPAERYILTESGSRINAEENERHFKMEK
jgi:hypothetical protein